MCTKLESLSAFQNKSINQMAMNKIMGGNAPVATGAGSTSVPTSVSSTGCMSYTSDITETSNGGNDMYGCSDTAA
jgi:hypothetical protein